MSLTNPNHAVTAQRLQEFHQGILPYLNGPKVELKAPTLVWDKSSNAPFSYQYTIETSGNYLVYVNPRSTSISSSLSCSGDQLYYDTFQMQSSGWIVADGKIGIYNCEAEDLITLSMSGSTGAGMFYAAIVNLNDISFGIVDLEAGGTGTYESSTPYSISSSTAGKKFIFSAINLISADSSKYIEIDDSLVSDIKENNYETTGDSGRCAKVAVANCNLSSGESVSVSGLNGAWGTTAAYIFSLT